MAILKVFATLRLVKVEVNSETGNVETTNLTILNVFLVNLGPMKEDTLVKTLISTQACVFYRFTMFEVTDDLGCVDRGKYPCVRHPIWVGVAPLRWK